MNIIWILDTLSTLNENIFGNGPDCYHVKSFGGKLSLTINYNMCVSCLSCSL